MKFLLNISLLFLLLQGCSEDDCGACFTPPNLFQIEIVDKATGENVFTSGAYTVSDIKVENLLEGNAATFTFIDENDLNMIRFQEIGWETEKVKYSISLDGEEIFTFYVDAERKSEDCCSFTVYREVVLEGAEYEFDSSTEIYKILLDE
ncbi:hypothetical protein [Chondrinema litorale]|uniref:hypothetical protein n=1 Tax=Chondrinema litorale TaxID=2994555 RepID=UPI0025429080|nr:hypothetical protein [Chondrinema litorale]UZR99204.1 hypothetical protein OQ292_35645 [Chondrinema litorale]